MISNCCIECGSTEFLYDVLYNQQEQTMCEGRWMEKVGEE